MASHPTIKAGPIQSSPMPLVPDDPVSTSHHNLSSPPERLVTRSTPSSTVHSRETSAVRGRALDHSALAPATLQPQGKRRGHSHSKSPETGSVRPSPGNDAPLERRPSNSYGHHRQTSIVHGIQRSRNPSFAASTTSTSPLSPELIANLSRSGGAEQELTGIGRLDFTDMHSAHQSPSVNGTANHNAQGMLSTIEDRDTDDVPDGASPVSVAHRRMNSAGKPWRERSHSRSHSRHLPVESKTVGEYALHHLFNSFVGQADNKINQAIMKLGESDTPVEDVCGPSADPKFDQLISALGYIARQKPKPLIDTIMFWRKAKGDAVIAHKHAASQSKPPTENGLLPRRNTEPTQAATDTSPHSGQSPGSLLSRHDDIVLTERRATVSVYLVCRVLIEIFNQSSLESITIDMADRLEDIVFGQLKQVDPEQIAASPLRMANWRIYSQLLGIMSEDKFGSVTNRFLAELERHQKDESTRGPSKEGDAKSELLLCGLKHIRIKTTPDKWPRSCDFMRSLARLFVNAHGQRIKQTYCNMFERLLLPVAANPTCDLNLPKWKEFLELVHSRLPSMLTKPRHWPAAFPLHVLLLCLSSKENFSSQWLSIIQSLPAKLKDRPTRGPALQAMCRLVWTYFFRYSDSPTVTLRKVEEVARIALPAGKRTYLSTDPAVSEPLTQLVRMIGFKHPDVCFRNIIFPLLNSDYFTSSGRDVRIDQMEPEKMVIGIQSFLAIVTDLENCDQLCPPVPTGSIPNPFTDPAASAHLFRSQYLIEPRLPGATDTSSQDLSPPVNISRLSDNVKSHYLRFCEILGNITILCDNTFGGQAALDEKFGGTTPKTPITDAFFGRREEHLSAFEQRQGFYDLLHVAVQALPRCLSDHIPFNSLINLLCTGTAHVQSNIAYSSAESLKAIARQSHAQQVTMGFARFIFNFDARYSTMSDEGMLGPGHIESTLRLYVELLRIWIEEIKQKTKGTTDSGEKNGSVNRALHLDLSSVLAQVEEVESHGLFFLCSQSRRVRSFAITVLRLITEFDKALGKENTRIIRILEADSQQILDLNDEHLTVAERSRIQKGKRRSASQNTLIELCSSEVSYDSTLWSKVFPNIVRISFETCPFAVTLGREIVCARLVHMHKAITSLAETPQHSQYPPVDAAQARSLARSNMTAEILIEQWKLYLVMACTTLNSVGAQSQSQLANAQHARKSSKGSQSSDKIGSARSLFAFVIPLMSAERASIRDAIVVALGSINQNLYRTLLESLQYAVTTCNEEAKIRIGTHHRTPSSPRRSRKTDRLRTEVTHVYKLTSKFLKEPEVYTEDWIVNNLVTYAKDLRIFLSDAGVQNDWEFQSLRFHYCGLMEELFEGVNRTKDASRWIPFEARKSAFSLMEDWCGYSPNQAQISQREEHMRKLAIAQRQETSGELRGAAAAMEIEKKNLRAAALGAMASLCAGPISITTESGSVLQFDVGRMLSWIEIIFNTISDKWHAIGRRALRNLILHNKEHSYLLERSVEMCYVTERPKSLESYFEVVTGILIEHTDIPLGFWRILGAVLVTLGSPKREIRMKSAKLLRILEERQQKNSRLQDFDISISDKTTAVYKLAQFETSKRLAQQHSDLAFTLFSEFSMHFKKLQPDNQRNFVAAILPWVQTIELQVDPNGGPTAKSFMVLANLFEVTIKSSNVLPNEVQALWQALATGPHGGNVQLILDFVISLCLERKEQNFVEYAKQVVVFLSGTPAGSKVIEFFLMHVGPKNMVQERKEITPAPPDVNGLPYVADLATVLPVGNKQAGLSFGQVALIFLVDLMVAPVTLSLPEVVKLLHVVIILWDHYTLTVQEQAREMLVHLIHELIAAKIEDDEPAGSRQSIEDFVESIRRSDPKVVWEYEDSHDKEDSEDDSRVPSSMASVTRAVVEFFSLAYEGITDLWAKEALNWATSCPVRHLACRSFQVFRSISTCLDSRMLADMLARLSNTIADEEADYRTFSMEILTTLKILISSRAPSDLLRYPQLFWTTCACLNTIHETEFVESIGMLEKFMDRVDMSDPMVVGELINGQPPKWEGGFDGIQNLVYKGLKSSQSLNRTLDILHRLSGLPNNDLIGDGNRLLFTILANLSHFLRQFDTSVDDSKTLARATLLARVAEGEGCPRLAASLLGFANGQYKAENDFLNHIITEIKSYYFPQQDVQSLTFLMGLLTNATDWFRVKVMKILCAVIPEVEMRRPDIASHGPDLISPLLRLLQTDLCPQALQVMDHIMTVSGSPLERHHIRMSMASSTSSKAIRKEYERIQSLYGIPEPTGWSIPMPAAQSGVTRNNVHAVFYTCAEVDRAEAQETVPSEVEFHADDYSENFFPMRADTMQSIETQTDGNMGDIVQKLDSLDDFFEDTETSHPALDALPDMALRGFAGSYVDTNANIYDQQTAPILRKSLARTASTSSFHNGLVDSRPPNMRFDSAGLHSTGTSTPHSSTQTLRPVSHSRSVTSPVNHVFSPPAGPQFSSPQIGTHELTFLSDDEIDDGGFDFDERLMVNKHPVAPFTHQTRSVTDGSSSLESMIRSGMRRLTGSTAASRDKERQREFVRAQHRAVAQTANSPRVPKVPAEYLGGATSNPNSPG
ncbi:cell morphogenesis N-terminal-domain-containing protein [Aspergillus filifer]